MRLRVSMIVLTGLIVLCGSGCSVSRRSVVKAESLEVRAESSEMREASVALEVVDTVKEVTMITVRENEAGDTVRMVQVTERERVRSRERVQEVVEKVVVRVDTVYVERRDSVVVERPSAVAAGSGDAGKGSAVVSALKWAFWLVVAVGVVIFGLKFFKLFHF